MKNIEKFGFIILILAVIISSCKKNNLVIGKDIEPPSFVKFNRLLATDTMKTYYINSAGNPFKLVVGLTTIADKDRTISFTYTSNTAVQGAQFNAPASIVIPAGKALDTLAFSGLFAGYTSTAKIDTVKITISGGDVPASPYYSTYYLILRKYCDVVLPSLAGTYANTNEYNSDGTFSYGPYTTVVKNLVATGTTTATGTVENLYNDGWNDINFTLDWTNPASFKVTIPTQLTGKSYSGAPTSVKTSTTVKSTFSSCDNSFTISVDLVNLSTSTTVSSAYKFVLKL